MDFDFSEFSYGYAITDELTKSFRQFLSAAPQFPSLLEEGKPGRGYDLKLSLDIVFVFLQFKLSHHMVRRSAVEWNYFGHPYFRIHLRSKRLSKQHQLLIELERKHRRVYYASPTFAAGDQLNSYYLSHRVIANTLFVMPSQ